MCGTRCCLFFRLITAQGSRIAISRDVYLVYWKIAVDVGAQPLALDTFPDFDLEALLGVCLDAATLALLDTNQVLYLDSLSKGWLHENVFGAAIVPPKDQGIYECSFHEAIPRQVQLYVAQEMLSTQRDFPTELKAAIEHRRSELLRVSEQAGLPMRSANNGYFAIIEKSANEVLDKHGLLTIPVAAFGSTAAQFCLASGLPVAEAP